MHAIARELYSLDRDAFTARRDEHVRALKAAGDKGAATQVAALRRPTVAAWAVNLVARQRPHVVEALLALGPQLQQAQQHGDADALRRLAQQQRREVAAAVHEARACAAECGTRLSEPAAAAVEATLRVAVADPEVARLVSAGVIAREREPGGFPGAGSGAWPPPPAAASADQGLEPTDEQAAVRAALADAQAAATAADQARGEAEQHARLAQARRDAVADELVRLQALLADAQHRVDTAERELDAARLHVAHATELAATTRARAEQLRAAVHLPEISGRTAGGSVEPP